MKRIVISKSFTFEASHVLPKHEGKCSRLHGHSWKLTVSVSGPVNPETGFVVDYGALGVVVKVNVIDLCDHYHLGCGNIEHSRDSNGVRIAKGVFGEHFYPSSENLVVAFARILGPLVQELGTPELVEVEQLIPGQKFYPGAVMETQTTTRTIPSSIQLEEVALEETCTCKAIWRRNA